jgi:hypothetical protein
MALDATPSAIPIKDVRSGEILDAMLFLPGHCFRIVQLMDMPSFHCDAPVAWKGLWRDPNGELWTVEACREHVEALEGHSRIAISQKG